MYQGIKKERSEADLVAVMIMSKIQEMRDGANSSCIISSFSIFPFNV